MNAEEVDGAETKGCESNGCKNRFEESSPRVGFPVHYRSSEFLYPLLFISIPIEAGLTRRLQGALLAFRQRNEPEWLLGAVDRNQHFCRAKHRSPVSLEHQLNNGTPIQRLG